MSDFETWWEREGQEFLYALNTTTDDDIKLVAEVAWKNGAYKVEQQGCDYCNHPLYAGTKCNNCGKAEQQEPVDQVGVKHDTQLAETFLRCPMTGNQLYFANEPIQKKGMNYMRLQDKEGNDWTLIARLDEGWDGK